MTAEQRLSAFLDEAKGPERDPAFSLDVMRQVARVELRRSLTTGALLAILASLVLWASAPALAAVLEPTAEALGPVAAVLIATATFVWYALTASPLRARV
jgi:hypothetical protein